MTLLVGKQETTAPRSICVPADTVWETPIGLTSPRSICVPTLAELDVSVKEVWPRSICVPICWDPMRY